MSLEDATLFEVFPGSEWSVLAGRQLEKKDKHEGRRQRRLLLEHLGIRGLPDLPTHDQNDALVGAYLAWCSRHLPDAVKLVGSPPTNTDGVLREGFILHGAQAVEGVDGLDSFQLKSDQEKPIAHEPITEDWTSGESLVLKLIDYGVVWGPP